MRDGELYTTQHFGVRAVMLIVLITGVYAYAHVGETNRAVGEHQMNRVSTRSHCVFTIYINNVAA